MNVPTASQTVGPYFRIGLDWPGDNDLVKGGVEGEPIRIEGRVLDAEGRGVADALIETWQANAHGKYRHPADLQNSPEEAHFTGAGRAETSSAGTFAFRTIKPGPVPAVDGGFQAPHISIVVFARGLLTHVHTRLYFPDETAANAEDPVLARVPRTRRQTLIARVEAGAYHFDIRLSGPGETVFFEL